MTEQEETPDLCRIFTYIPPFSDVCALFPPPFPFPLRAPEHPGLSCRNEKKRNIGCGNQGKNKSTQGNRVSLLVHSTGRRERVVISGRILFPATFACNFYVRITLHNQQLARDRFKKITIKEDQNKNIRLNEISNNSLFCSTAQFRISGF